MVSDVFLPKSPVPLAQLCNSVDPAEICQIKVSTQGTEPQVLLNTPKSSGSSTLLSFTPPILQNAAIDRSSSVHPGGGSDGCRR